eukprot:gene16618-biopygen8450
MCRTSVYLEIRYADPNPLVVGRDIAAQRSRALATVRLQIPNAALRALRWGRRRTRRSHRRTAMRQCGGRNHAPRSSGVGARPRRSPLPCCVR